MAVVLGAVSVLLPGARAAAQDAHYWSQQYGTRSELLGGTVVGSPQDLSTTYYNPGGLTFLESQSFLLSALALEYEKYVLGRDPEATEVEADRFGAAPILVAGTLPRDWVAGAVAYSYLSREKLEARIDAWHTFERQPGEPVGNLLIDARVSESWGGITWARPFGPFGVGVSGYIAYRNQRGREEFLSQPLPDVSSTVHVTSVNDYSYWHVRALAKVGLYWERRVISAGLTFTTPGAPLFGSGEAAYYRSVTVSDPSGPEVDDGLVVEDPEVTYRSPTSVALGTRVEAGRAAFYLTAEWFDSVDRYGVLSAPELPAAGVGTSLTALTRQELESVVNVGAGAEFAPSPDLTLFGSFITDYGATAGDREATHSFATWDIYQATAGAAFSVLRADFTLGLSFGRGGDEIYRRNDFDGRAIAPGRQVRYQRWKIFLGFEFRGSGSSAGE